MPPSIVIQKPSGVPDQLILLFHGVGSNAQDLVPVGKQFATQYPAAMVVSLEGPQPSDLDKAVNGSPWQVLPKRAARRVLPPQCQYSSN
jgi:phospholipase/carboxylesterase